MIGTISHAQRVRNKIAMDTVRELRQNPGSIRGLDGARCMLSIPPLEYEMLCLKYPVLVQGATYEKKRFIEQFIQSDESKPYRVSP